MTLYTIDYTCNIEALQNLSFALLNGLSIELHKKADTKYHVPAVGIYA